jgi:hypothetical protein
MTSGTYGGGTFGTPWGLGGGLYVDNHGRIYPQLYGGSPGFSFSGGYTPDLEGLLTGPSISGGPGKGPIGYNVGGNAGTIGAGIGTPGISVTHGFGPIEASQDYSQPWLTPAIRDSAARAGVPSRYNVMEYGFPDANTGRAGNETGGVLKWLGDGLIKTREAGPSELLPLPPTAPEFPSRDGGSIADVNESTSPLAMDDRRYLSRRVASEPRAIPFGNGAPAVPFVPSNASLSPDLPNSLDDGFGNSTSATGGMQPGQPRQLPRSLGLFTGRPMPDWPVPPPIFDVAGRSGAGNDSVDGREAPTGTGIPFLDEYIGYLNQSHT